MGETIAVKTPSTLPELLSHHSHRRAVTLDRLRLKPDTTYESVQTYVVFAFRRTELRNPEPNVNTKENRETEKCEQLLDYFRVVYVLLNPLRPFVTVNFPSRPTDARMKWP